MKEKSFAVSLGGACVAAGLIAAACVSLSSEGFVPDTSCGEYEGDFRISGTRVTPDSRYIARFRVLGAEISANGAYDIPVTLSIQIGNEVFEPFGPQNSPTTGNVNDHDHPKDFILQSQYPANTPFTIRGQSWKRRNASVAPQSDAGWKSYINVATNSNSSNLLVLRNDDPVPQIEPFLNQDLISNILRDHINPLTDRIVLAEDEVIFLFELGTTNLNSAAADFQDLVVLVTLAEDECHFGGPRIPPIAQYD